MKKKDPFGYGEEDASPKSFGEDDVLGADAPVAMPRIASFPRSPIMGAPPEISLEDYNAHVARLETAMSGAHDVLRFLRGMKPRDLKLRRMPFGLINRSEADPHDGRMSELIAPGSTGSIMFSPDVMMRPKFMVLSEETAESFNIIQFLVCNVNQCRARYHSPWRRFR